MGCQTGVIKQLAYRSKTRIAPLNFPRLLQDGSVENISIGVFLILGELSICRER